VIDKGRGGRKMESGAGLKRFGEGSHFFMFRLFLAASRKRRHN